MLRDLPRVSGVPAIYDHIRGHLDESGCLTLAGAELPDDAKAMSGRLRWVGGAMDGALGRVADDAAVQAEKVARAIVGASKRPSKRNLRKLYAAVADDEALGFVDALLEELTRLQLDLSAVYGLGRWLATTAADRGAVKVGIALMGAAGEGEDLDVLRTLGSHDEFTLYVTVAMKNSLEDADAELWEVAKRVDGWGRIQCVDRLRDTQDPAIRRWLLREGFRNSIMYEYLAYTAATTGGLLEALRDDSVDRELLTAAGEIIEALVQGGPAEDMDDYDAAADATEVFLALMDERAETLGDFHAVAAIRSFLGQETDWDWRSVRGWTASRREAFEAHCDEILSRDEWEDRITVGLLSDDGAEFWRADKAARLRGGDTFEVHIDKIRHDPLDASWFDAWEQADSEPRAEQLVELVRELIPLEAIATGPADEIGLGPDWKPHSALDWSLQALANHPGAGADLLIVGLHSPVTRNRNMSLKALKEWPRSAWPDGASQLLNHMAASDPNLRTRESAAETLSTEAI